jgi:hypothetical protein
MARKVIKTNSKAINDYLEEIGATDATNKFLIDELNYNETLGNQLKNELKGGLFTDKGKLTQAFLGYKMFLTNKILLCTKLAMTVQDRKKLRLKDKPDGVQLQIEEFMEQATN